MTDERRLIFVQMSIIQGAFLSSAGRIFLASLFRRRSFWAGVREWTNDRQTERKPHEALEEGKRSRRYGLTREKTFLSARRKAKSLEGRENSWNKARVKKRKRTKNLYAYQFIKFYHWVNIKRTRKARLKIFSNMISGYLLIALWKR